ncbi:MAG: DVUA0089 family protein [Azoarcus sp.]|jgi:hypothetical protein|nr:DVUA0089 family protein [Azoarcus sp.]
MKHLVSALVAAGLLSAAAVGQAATTVDGTFTDASDVAWVEFSVDYAGYFSFFVTDSAKGGNFEPILTLWTDAGNYHSSAYDTAGGGDAALFANLDSGAYYLSITASPNWHVGNSFYEGFRYTGQTLGPLAGGASWNLDINGAVNPASIKVVPSPAPEPETYAMLLAGLGLIGAVARRRTMSA